MMRQFLVGLLGLTWLVYCSSCHRRVDQELERYITGALDSVARYSIHQDFNFDSLESACVGELSDTSTMAHVHWLLHLAVNHVDKHSALITPENSKEMISGGGDAVPDPFPFSGKILSEKYAYVDVLPFPGIDSTSVDNYVDSLQILLRSLYDQQPAGWIIDLRTNSGGNPYAMIGGLGALLGEGTLMTSISFDGTAHDRFYMRKDSTGEIEKLELVDSAYVFEKKLPISVLVGPETGSAAEALTLAFKGLEHSVILGQPTLGVATGLQPVYLPDSACMLITNSIDHDRFGNAYHGPIQPNEVIGNPLELFERSYKFIDQSSSD